MSKRYNCKFTKEQIEVLLQETTHAYMDYNDGFYQDAEIQKQYKECVKHHNDLIDCIRIELKEKFN